MRLPQKVDISSVIQLNYVILLISFLSSCSIPILRKVPKDRYFLRKSKIEITGGKFTKSEESALKERLWNQLDDSSKVPSKDAFIFLEIIKRPPVYDSSFTNISARNMEGSMFHLGYYHARVIPKTDTAGKKVYVTYDVMPGNPTLIDTVRYRLKIPGLQEIAQSSMDESLLKKNDPITKNAILGEISRLVDSFRNNGYYKFTAAELKVRGDTTIEALTSVSDDPFEQLRLLAEAQQKKDSPQIKLAVILNFPADSSKLNKYVINKIYVLSDFIPGDDISDSSKVIQRNNRHFVHRYHNKLFRSSFLSRNITFKSGDLYRQTEYYNTINNLAQTGVWQSINIRIIEVTDSSNSIDLVIELIPAKKYGFEAALELSYSTSINASNVLGGNLFGISGNLSLTNRNVGKEAIRMSHKIRAGIELNNNNRGSYNSLINSNEVGYSNSIVIPRLVLPGLLKTFAKPFSSQKKNFILPKGESFIYTSLSYNNRLDLYNLQSVNLNMGWSWLDKRKFKWEIKPFNMGFSYLFNQSDSFKRILLENPFLRYSYNTAYAVGMSAGVSNQYLNPRHPGSVQKERNIKFSAEESGLTWGNLGILKNYLRRYVKFDAEYKYTVSYSKSALAFRLYTGIGIPLLGSDSNRTLPFFKQYLGGGSNSMKGWPIRGIGVGGQPLTPYGSNNGFNDRTGDMQLEGNAEFRYDIARIIPNTLTLRGALFVDVGNIWNIRNSKKDGTTDSTQFRFKNLYSQLGMSAGTGFRLDFNYFVIRFDFGFRFKRPELFYKNDGWKAPNIGFDNFFNKIVAPSEKKWRYENFNFSIGISYPF